MAVYAKSSILLFAAMLLSEESLGSGAVEFDEIDLEGMSWGDIAELDAAFHGSGAGDPAHWGDPLNVFADADSAGEFPPGTPGLDHLTLEELAQYNVLLSTIRTLIGDGSHTLPVPWTGFACSLENAASIGAILEAGLYKIQTAHSPRMACRKFGIGILLPRYCPALFAPSLRLRLVAEETAFLCSARGSDSRALRHKSQVLPMTRSDPIFRSANFLCDLDAEALLRPFRVKMAMEMGVDRGGVFKEWQSLFTSSLINQVEGEWLSVGSSTGVMEVTPKYKTMRLVYQAIGRFLGIAFRRRLPVALRFPLVYYARLLGVQLSLEDMETEDPALYRSLVLIRGMDPADLASLEIAVFDDGTHPDVLFTGEGTDEKIVTKLNYVHEDKEEALGLIVSGFHDIVPRESVVGLFSPADLRLVLSGPGLDLADWQHNARYGLNVNAASDRVVWFWHLVESMDDATRRLLLRFVTGSTQVPAGGFSRLDPAFTIEGEGRDVSVMAPGAPPGEFESHRLPSAHTCTNTLDLPNYPTPELLAEKLLFALRADPAMGIA